MKKGDIKEGLVQKVSFPDKGEVSFDENRKAVVKRVLPGQEISFRIKKLRRDKCEGELLKVIKKAPGQIEADCPHFSCCGGCTYRELPYEDQLKLKQEQVLELLGKVCGNLPFEGIKTGERKNEYRNKMEFSFGDEYKGGPLSLGMHKRGSFYDVVTTDQCRIVDGDFRLILKTVLELARSYGLAHYHKIRHEGYLRHLLIRKAAFTGQILVDIVTAGAWPPNSRSEEEFEKALTESLCSLPLEGALTGILHTANDSPADTITDQGTVLLYGRDFLEEKLLGLTFRISPFSFFQTNSSGAQTLYRTVQEYAADVSGKVIFDLYSGTGTIAQILSPTARHVTGIEIVGEAVSAARENARQNGLENCTFIEGDVLKEIDSIEEKPDLIILDPPRDGIHPKALPKIMEFGVENIIYISCKPVSLARDLVVLQAGGYEVKRCCCVDMFPSTGHVETVCLLTHS